MSWVLLVGFGLAYFGGGMGMLVYHDAKQQGKSKRVASLYTLGIGFTFGIIYSLILTFVK